MSWRNNRRSGTSSSSQRRNHQELDLKLNLSPPRMAAQGPQRAAQSPELSPTKSCVSTEENLKYSSSPESSSKTVVLVGCPRCLMYFMVPETDLLCPSCKSAVILDFIHPNDGVVDNTRPTN